jgi:hypothetical protein
MDEVAGSDERTSLHTSLMITVCIFSCAQPFYERVVSDRDLCIDLSRSLTAHS